MAALWMDRDPKERLRACMRLISKMPTLATIAYKTSIGTQMCLSGAASNAALAYSNLSKSIIGPNRASPCCTNFANEWHALPKKADATMHS